jgi:hypothetical protein
MATDGDSGTPGGADYTNSWNRTNGYYDTVTMHGMASVQDMFAHAIQETLKEITPPGQDWSETMHASWRDDVDRGSCGTS